MPRNVEQHSSMSDQGHIFGQLMREQCTESEEIENRASDKGGDVLESAESNQEGTSEQHYG